MPLHVHLFLLTFLTDSCAIGIFISSSSQPISRLMPPSRWSWASSPPAGDDLATFDAGPLTVSGPLPLSGSAHLVMKKNGDFTFNSHAHDAGFDNIDFLISAVLLTPSGIAFTFQHSGHLEGTSGALLGTPNRNDDFVTGGNNVAITNEWSGVSVAKLVARIDGGDDLGRGVAAFLGDVLNAAAQELGKELGQAAAKAVIALVAA
jgi:hypothetical protein